MTMGPDPMRRMVLRSVRLGIYQVAKGLIEGTGGLPPGLGDDLGRVADEMRHVGRAEERRGGFGKDADPGGRGEALEELADRDPLPPRHVVHLAGAPALGE